MSKYPELKTIRDFMRYAMSQFNEAALFYGHGTEDAQTEARALVLHSLHLPFHLDDRLMAANLTAAEQQRLYSLIELRVERRIPVPYLTNEAWFAQLSFYVDERVLIPRSPLAELIESHFKPWVLTDQINHVLDLCTGSGCIAVACAKIFPQAKIDASDISSDALAVAKINVLRHSVEDQIKLYQSDLFSKLPRKQYDIIISNPPYVSAAEMENLPPEYTHEPTLALHAGTHGLDTIIRILATASEYLRTNGILVIEVGNSEYALIERFPSVPFTWLTFERGGDGVFLLTKEQLQAHQSDFQQQCTNV